MFGAGVVRKRGDARGQDQPTPPGGIRSTFAGVPAVDERTGAVQPRVEKLLIGLKLEHVGLDAVRIRDHAVVGDDGEAFDAIRTGHRICSKTAGVCE
jgi:hypothetical protein